MRSKKKQSRHKQQYNEYDGDIPSIVIVRPFFPYRLPCTEVYAKQHTASIWVYYYRTVCVSNDKYTKKTKKNLVFLVLAIE